MNAKQRREKLLSLYWNNIPDDLKSQTDDGTQAVLIPISEFTNDEILNSLPREVREIFETLYGKE
jgi:predicted Zn-dependent protease with MMP-like domain